MSISIDLARGVLTHSAGELRNKRVCQFLAALKKSSDDGVEWAPLGFMTAAVGAELKETRYLFQRIVDKIHETDAIADVIEFRSKTVGPWRLKLPASVNIIGNQNLKVEPTKLGDTFGPDVLGDFAIGIASEAPIFSVEGDIAFDAGALVEAGKIYERIGETQPNAVSMAAKYLKLIQVAIRLEDYADLLSKLGKLDAVSKNISDPQTATYLSARSTMAWAWHAYKKDEKFSICNARLDSIKSDAERFSSLHLDWLNLKGLTERRIAQEHLKREDFDEFSRHASVSILTFERQVRLSLFFGSHYQIQRATANYANVIAALLTNDSFRSRAKGIDPLLALEFAIAAERVCILANIGKDDIFNCIFILSMIRKHSISRDLIYRIGGAEKIFGGRSLSEYGKQKHEMAEVSMTKIPSVQKAYLAFEIAWAAIDDDDLQLFAKYFKEMVQASWDSPSVRAVEVPERANRLFMQVRKLKSQKRAWLREIEDLDKNVIPQDYR